MTSKIFDKNKNFIKNKCESRTHKKKRELLFRKQIFNPNKVSFEVFGIFFYQPAQRAFFIARF